MRFRAPWTFIKNYFADGAIAGWQKMLAEKRKDIAWAERDRRKEVRENEERIDEYNLQIAKNRKAIKRAENDRLTIEAAWQKQIERLQAEEAAILAEIARLEGADVITPTGKTIEFRSSQ